MKDFVNSRMPFLISFIVLLLVIGFPRIYGTEVPMAVVLIPFFIMGFMKFILSKSWVFFGIFGVGSLWIIGGVFSFMNGNGTFADLFFHFILSFKMILNFFFGYVIYIVLKRNISVLLAWLVFQLFIIVLSMYSEAVYSFLLGFISPRSAEVFQYIFGLRALGFGLFHMDGALLLVIAVFYYLLVAQSSVFKGLVLILFLPISMAIARSALVPYLIFGLFRRGVYIKASLISAAIIMFVIALYATSGPLFEATELFRNMLNNGELSSKSVTHLSTMFVWPQSVSTWLFGDGQYFDHQTDSLSFYMLTDVGFLRVLYFSGLFSVFIFILLNLYYLFALLFSSKYHGSREIKLFSISLILLFIVINFKGIQLMPLFSMVLYMYALDMKNLSCTSNKNRR